MMNSQNNTNNSAVNINLTMKKKKTAKLVVSRDINPLRFFYVIKNILRKRNPGQAGYPIGSRLIVL